MVHIHIVVSGRSAAIMVHRDPVVLIVVGGKRLDSHGTLDVPQLHLHLAIHPVEVLAGAVDDYIVIIIVCGDLLAVHSEDQTLNVLAGIQGLEGNRFRVAVIDDDLIAATLKVRVAVMLQGDDMPGLLAVHINGDVTRERVEVQDLAAIGQRVNTVGTAVQGKAVFFSGEGHPVSGRADCHRGDLREFLAGQANSDRIANLWISLVGQIALHIGGGVDGQPSFIAATGGRDGHIGRNSRHRDCGLAVGCPGDCIGMTVDRNGSAASCQGTGLATILNDDRVDDTSSGSQNHLLGLAGRQQLGNYISRHIADSYDRQLILAGAVRSQGRHIQVVSNVIGLHRIGIATLADGHLGAAHLHRLVLGRDNVLTARSSTNIECLDHLTGLWSKDAAPCRIAVYSPGTRTRDVTGGRLVRAHIVLEALGTRVGRHLVGAGRPCNGNVKVVRQLVVGSGQLQGAVAVLGQPVDGAVGQRAGGIYRTGGRNDIAVHRHRDVNADAQVIHQVDLTDLSAGWI